MRSIVMILVFGTALFGAAWAASDKDADGARGAPASIQSVLQGRYPDVKVIDVRPSPVDGVFEVFTGDSIVYTDRTANHLFSGSLVDTRTKQDLTGPRLDERNAVAFDSLPLDRAIRTVKGNGARKMAVFSDPDCPFCRQLENDLAGVTDITIYTFLYPIASLHPKAPEHARAIWCSADRSAAWSQWMLHQKEPKAQSCQTDALDEISGLAKKLHIGGTPTLYLSDGRRVTGGVPSQRLHELLSSLADQKHSG
jgi:thiol:disulfide interchange protein DsbC